jgi:hypothetical protein
MVEDRVCCLLLDACWVREKKLKAIIVPIIMKAIIMPVFPLKQGSAGT